MTGPDIFRQRAGSNAIGNFIIGVSPIGSIEAFDVWKTVLSQYANSRILMQLIQNMDAYLDQTLNFDAFFDLVFNVDTAQGWGLDVWGRIVDVSRTLEVPGDLDYWGFEGATGSQPFNQGTFFYGQIISSNFNLSDTAYRTLIFAKALANISDGSIPSINQILLNLFPGRGNCYVIDGLDMTMTYKFEFALSPVEQAIVAQSRALPKSTGVPAITVSV